MEFLSLLNFFVSLASSILFSVTAGNVVSSSLKLRTASGLYLAQQRDEKRRSRTKDLRPFLFSFSHLAIVLQFFFSLFVFFILLLVRAVVDEFRAT